MTVQLDLPFTLERDELPEGGWLVRFVPPTEVDRTFAATRKALDDPTTLPYDQTVQGLTESRVRRLEADAAARYQLAAAQWTPPPASGEILVELAKPSQPVQYVVEDLAPSRANVLLVAEAKAGKTTLVMNLVKAIVEEAKFLDRYKIDALPADSSVTYLNFELDKDMAENWLREMGVGQDDAPHRHPFYLDHWKGHTLPLPSDHVEDWLVGLLLQRGSSVLVIDPYGAVINHDENSNDDTRAWTNAIDRIARRADLALVVIAAHSGSSSSAGGDLRVRGAYRLEDWMSVKWTYTHSGDVNEAPPDNLRYLTARGRDVAVPQFTIDYDAPQRRLFHSGGGQTKAATRNDRWALKTYDALKERNATQASPLNATELVEAVNVRANDTKRSGPVRAGIKEAIERGWIATEKQGRSKMHWPGPVDPYAETAAAGLHFKTHRISDGEGAE